MVDMALAQLKKNGIVQLDEERKAAMVSNLLVVLCSERPSQPIVNTGSNLLMSEQKPFLLRLPETTYWKPTKPVGPGRVAQPERPAREYILRNALRDQRQTPENRTRQPNKNKKGSVKDMLFYQSTDAETATAPMQMQIPMPLRRPPDFPGGIIGFVCKAYFSNSPYSCNLL